MYLQTSRSQYNFPKVGVFQKAHSDKIIQAKLVKTLYHRYCCSSSNELIILQ